MGIAWQVGYGLNIKSNLLPSRAPVTQDNYTAEQKGPEVSET